MPTIQKPGALLAALLTATPAQSAETLCQGAKIPLDLSIGLTPIARLTLGGRAGNVLLDTGATGSAVDATAFSTPVGRTVSLGFSLPEPGEVAFTGEDMRGYRAPEGGQQGRIGTNILSQRTIEFHYEASPPFAAVRILSCDSAALRTAGFVEIGLPGFYAASPANRSLSKPNVPVVALRLGPVLIPAQLDTGFDDEFMPGILQANAALLAALRAQGIAMQRVPSAETHGCDLTRANERWQIDTAALELIAPGGQTAGSYRPPLLEVKADPACGGIATFAEPFGQIGASWLARWRTTILDGPAGRVWVRR